MSNFFKDLEDKIQAAYTSGTDLQEAERLAGEFLYAQSTISAKLAKADLDSRMRKAGLKAIKASIYMEAATKTDKKPSDTLLENLVTMHEVVVKEQDAFDQAEVRKEELERYFNICKEAHIFFRGIAKGRFE